MIFTRVFGKSDSTVQERSIRQQRLTTTVLCALFHCICMRGAVNIPVLSSCKAFFSMHTYRLCFHRCLFILGPYKKLLNILFLLNSTFTGISSTTRSISANLLCINPRMVLFESYKAVLVARQIDCAGLFE